jgi:hypothetical protein
MNSNVMQRRQFNRYLTAVLLSTVFPRANNALAVGEKPCQWLASASEDFKGRHWLIVVDINSVEQLRYQLPNRAHEVIKHPSKPWLLVVARRPGNYLIIIHMHTGHLVSEFTSAVQQHFCGHMQVSIDGRYLYTTENITATSDGLIVVRDLFAQGRIIGQFSSGGIGPHQLRLSPQGSHLIVANGGIKTLRREKMNLASMQSNLSYIYLATKSIEERVVLNQQYSQLSIRHIDVNNDGWVLIAMQFQGARTEQVPLVGLHKANKGLTFLAIPDSQYFSLKHYCGSACFDSSGQTMAISAPKGDKILCWSLNNHQYIGTVKVRDGSGLAKTDIAGEFIISSGRGRMYRYNAYSTQKQLLLNDPSMQWDNHLASL